MIFYVFDSHLIHHQGLPFGIIFLLHFFQASNIMQIQVLWDVWGFWAWFLMNNFGAWDSGSTVLQWKMGLDISILRLSWNSNPGKSKIKQRVVSKIIHLNDSQLPMGTPFGRLALLGFFLTKFPILPYKNGVGRVLKMLWIKEVKNKRIIYVNFIFTQKVVVTKNVWFFSKIAFNSGGVFPIQTKVHTKIDFLSFCGQSCGLGIFDLDAFLPQLHARSFQREETSNFRFYPSDVGNSNLKLNGFFGEVIIRWKSLASPRVLPQKLRWSPKRQLFEKENHLPKPSFWGSIR